MSSYLDTGSVLIESACNVERIAAVLHPLTPFIPGFKYYRWAPPPLHKFFVVLTVCANAHVSATTRSCCLIAVLPDKHEVNR